MGSGKTSRAETFTLSGFSKNLKTCLPKPSKPQFNSQFGWHLRYQSSKVDTEEDLSGEPGLVTSTKEGNHSSSMGGRSSKARSGRVSSPRGLDGNNSIRVTATAPSLQSSITFLS